jgi:hypothetical protein
MEGCTGFCHCCNVTRFASRLILLSMCDAPHVIDVLIIFPMYEQFLHFVCIVLDFWFCKVYVVCKRLIIIFVAFNARKDPDLDSKSNLIYHLYTC